jgi:class 3 adenylate cyclase/tetratricopeptide (TPR) repeat protein
VDTPWDFSVCPSCGASASPAVAEPVQERKVVSVLFCDLVGFTSFSEGVDPEDVRGLLTPYHRLLRTEIERLGGTVEKFIGDAVMAVFGAPVVREDDARRAVVAGMRILERLADLNRELAPVTLAVRIGIATGEVLVTVTANASEGEGIVAGDVVNTAARLQSAAEVGTVLVNEATRRATHRVVRYLDLPAVSVKGKAAPVSVWQVVALAEPAPDEDLAAFVGRAVHVDELTNVLQQTSSERLPRVVTVVGDAGIGKTTIIHETERRWAAAGYGGRWIRGRCLPRGEAHSFSLLSQWLSQSLDSDNLDSSGLAASLQRQVGRLFAHSSDSDRLWLTSRLGALLGLPSPAAASRDELFAAWSRYFVALATDQQLVLVADDCHSAESPLSEFLVALVEHAGGTRLCVIMAGRSDPTNAATVIRVPPMTDADLNQLIPHLLRTTTVSEELSQLLSDRAGGNPLFAGEFVRMLNEHGWVTRDGDEAALADEARRDELPDTVQAVIAARLDALPATLKRTLMDSAVLGTDVTASLLHAVVDSDASTSELRASLDELASRDLLGVDDTRRVQGTRVFRFTHGPIQEVAYQQMPRAARLIRHVRVAERLAKPSEQVSTDRAQRAAHHGERALSLAEQTHDGATATRLRELVIGYQVLAGDEAGYLDIEAAHDHYARALQLSRTDPDRARDPELLIKLGDSCVHTGRFDEAEQELRAAVDLLNTETERLASRRPSLLPQALIGLRRITGQQGHGGDGPRKLGEEILAALEGQPDLEAQFETGITQGVVKLDLGDLAGAEDAFSRAVAVANDIGNAHLIVRAHHSRCEVRYVSGDYVGALDDGLFAIATSRASGDERGPFLYNDVASMLLGLRSPAEALEIAEEGLRLARQRGYQSGAAWIEGSTRPEVLIDLGRWDEARESTLSCLQWAVDHGVRTVRLSCHVNDALITLYRQGRQAAYDQLKPHLDDLLNHSAQAQFHVSLVVLNACLAPPGTPNGTEARQRLRDRLNERQDVDLYMWLTDIARHLAELDDREMLARLIEGAPIGYLRITNAVLTTQALLAEAAGDRSTAATTYLQAANAWRSFGRRYEVAQALVGAARCTGADAPQRGTLLAQAAEIARALDAPALLAQIEQLGTTQLPT